MRLLVRSLVLLALAALLFSPAHAGMMGVDGMFGTVIQQNQSSFSSLGLRARVRDGRLIDAIEFLPYVEYWRNVSNVKTFGISAERSDATLGLDARYSHDIGSMHPYVGGGWGLHFIDSQVEAPALGLPHGEHSLVKGGLEALGGFSFPLGGNLDNIFEVKYQHVTDYSQWKIQMGLGYSFK